MTKRGKLVAGIVNNPRSVRFDDACRIAISIGFIHEGGKGSHRVFKRTGEPLQLNFQNRNGFVPAYQARQLADMLRKYGDQ